MFQHKSYLATSIFSIYLAIFFTGCAATQVAVSKRNLDVQNKMSATLFLDPVENDSEKTVFLQIKNTSDKQDFDIQSELIEAFGKKGYKVLSSPGKARYMVQANILQVGKSSHRRAGRPL